jgi:hypothetical protein
MDLDCSGADDFLDNKIGPAEYLMLSPSFILQLDWGANMDCGLIEIGNIATKASTDDIRKLKSILDEHRIFHIVDDVKFFHLHAETARPEVTHQGGDGEFDPTKHRLWMHKIRHGDCAKHLELIAPDLYELNYISLIFLDSEEADFLATLVYEGDRKNCQFGNKAEGTGSSEPPDDSLGST